MADIRADSGVTTPSAPATPPGGGAKAVPTLPQLFLAFASVSLSGLGGVLAWARRGLVEQRGWLTAEEFNNLFALSQLLPGPNIVNLTVVFGSRLHGPVGSLVGLAGLLGPPLVVVTTLGILYTHFQDVAALRRVLTGITAAAAGMLIANVFKMGWPLLRDASALGVLAVVFVAVGILRWPMPSVLAVMLPISIGLAWWMRR